MSRFSEAWKILIGKKAAPVRTFGAPSYQFINGQLVGIDDNKSSYITNGYTINDQLYSIISLILNKVKVPEWGTYKIVDESSLKSYAGIMRRKNLSAADFKKAMQYKEEALEPVETGKLSELLKYPNESESFQEFIEVLIGYKLLTGDYYQWAQVLEAGANAGKPQSFDWLPPQEVTIIADNSKYPIREAGYAINCIGWTTIPKEQVLHGKYWNPQWDVTGSHLYGLSPIKAALKKLTRNNSALKASGAMYQNQGVKGVLYVDDPRVLQAGVGVDDTHKQVNAVKQKLVNEWTGEDNFGKIGTSGYKMGWTEIGLSPVDLNIIESEKWDYIGLCNIYGVPPELLGLTAKTYNNMKEAETALTSRVAMPELITYRNSLNRWLYQFGGMKGSNIMVDFDQTCFTELQEDVAEKAKWVNSMKGVSPNWRLNQLGLETIDDPVMDEPWITPDMGMPLSEWNAAGENDTEDSDDEVPGDK